MRSKDKTCRFCLSEKSSKLEDISLKNASDTIVKAVKNVLGWKVMKSDALTKICMNCKATLLDIHIYVKKVKKNDKKWRKEWMESTSNDIIDLLSSDDENTAVKEEPDSDSESSESEMEGETPENNYNPQQYIKEEGETSESEEESEFKEEDELIIECDAVATLVSSTTHEDSGIALKKEKKSPIKKKTGHNLRDRPLNNALLEWSTTDDETQDDSEVEEIPIKKTPIDLTEDIQPVVPPPKESPPPPVSSTTQVCLDEIMKNGFKTLAEKMLAIKKNPNLTDDQMCKIFYGLTCHLCSDMDFNTLQELQSHLQETHGIVKISVKCCDVDIIRPIMVDHIKYHLGMQKTSLKDHIRRLKVSQICEECGLLFPSESSLKIHISRSHMALFSTLRTRSLSLDLSASHMYDISNGEFKTSRYQCDVCEKPFYYESSMKHHKIKHLSLEEQLQYKRFECGDCGEKFFEKSYLQKHIEVVHAKYRRMQSGKVTCLECNRVLSNIHHLFYHKVLHWTQEEQQRNLKYKCDDCPRHFLLKNGLTQHRKTHDPNRAHREPSTSSKNKCPHCSRTFSHNGNLLQHMRSHMSAKELYESKTNECSTCYKRFWTEDSLKDHIKFIHLKQYDHVCEKCKRPYANEHSLKYHSCGNSVGAPRTKNLSNEKHECEFCNKVFKQSPQLKSHMYQWHLPGYIHTCATCQKGFNFGKSYYKHIKICSKKTSKN